EDSRAILTWREQKGRLKTAGEIRNTLNSLRQLIAKLQKNTPISQEAGLEEKILVHQLDEAEKAEKSAQERQHQNLIARETPQLNAALEAYRRFTATYDFTRAAGAIRKVKLTEPSLRQMQSNYQNAADRLV